jgi:hypothetical protein
MMHFFNLAIFTFIRNRSAALDQSLPPVQPDGFTEMGV